MSHRLLLLLASAGLAVGLPLTAATDGNYFEPDHRLAGIGVGRTGLSDATIALRTRRMIQSQTFAILRDPHAAAGAQRILGPRLQRLFHRAADASGLPSSLIAAIAYIESWGEARAQSPTGPRGIMQIAAGTAHIMGLKIRYATRYHLRTRVRRLRTSHGKWIARRVRVRVPYRVLVRDDRLVPARAIPAAAKYLAQLAGRFGGLDWAVFAYHCGENCATQMRSLTEQAEGIGPPYTVPAMFFGASPAANRELYLAIEHQMERDYSPTYWFRVMRARELLALYRRDPAGFRELAAEYRSAMYPAQRAPNRLAVWLDTDEPSFPSCRAGQGGNLVPAFNDPEYYGFRLRLRRTTREGCLLAAPSALGALAYIAFETRRLHEAMDVKGERFVPLEVTSLVKPLARLETVAVSSSRDASGEAILQSTGHVFDIHYGELPSGEREAFEFVLNDLGWEGYLGFMPAVSSSRTLHIGCSPSSRPFFDKVFADAIGEAQPAAW